eukprot:Phypoly_transcript_24486.p1 GENE.Phypoly_transcript_24486~~Phypoly_transcript_24486.p1  ORF type:complete len:113 (+),score=12.65 Phypoly_transcript_24486:22-339(+)
MNQQPTLFVDIEKLKDYCSKQYDSYGQCLQKYQGEHQERMCSVTQSQLVACAEKYVNEQKKAVVRCTPEIQKYTEECVYIPYVESICKPLQEAMTACITRDIKKE